MRSGYFRSQFFQFFSPTRLSLQSLLVLHLNRSSGDSLKWPWKMRCSNQRDDPAFDADQLENAFGRKRKSRRSATDEQPWKGPNGPLADVTCSRQVDVFQTGARRQRKLLSLAFKSPATTNDPANVRPRRSRRGPEEEIPDPYTPRARRPRVNFHFQKWWRERGKDPSRVSTNDYAYA